MKLALLSLAGVLTLVNGWANLPDEKIRGVNLGGLFVSEPWMMTAEWKRMGCSGYKSEFDCMANVADAQAGFESHWNTWINESDFERMVSYGLNTVRIPLGHWIVESTVDTETETFPVGGFFYLRKICAWAKQHGISVILDLHGAPGAQQPEQPSTGKYVSTAEFYTQANYDRAYEFFTNLTTEVHNDPTSFGSVFMLEAVNEPYINLGAGPKGARSWPGPRHERHAGAKVGVARRLRLVGPPLGPGVKE